MAMDSFLVFSNNVKGESQDEKYKDAIDVLSWSWGLSNAGTTHLGAGGGGGKVSAQDITVTKYVDKASNELIKRCADGTHFARAMLVVRKAGGDASVEYLRLNMENVIVTSYQTGGSGDGLDRVMETVSLNFRSFDVIYQTQDEKGVAGPEAKAGWNLAENKAWSSGGQFAVSNGTLPS